MGRLGENHDADVLLHSSKASMSSYPYKACMISDISRQAIMYIHTCIHAAWPERSLTIVFVRHTKDTNA
jgi:hypothetical protein